MKHINLAIPDDKLQFFTELMNSLGFIKQQDHNSAEVDISEEHKRLILKRIENSTSKKMTDWEDFKKELDK